MDPPDLAHRQPDAVDLVEQGEPERIFVAMMRIPMAV
jgi:hypothetical protein